MTIYYADPAGSNTSPYDTWTKAATNIQSVLDLAIAQDTIYCRGTQTTAATIDVDTQTGAQATGYIKVIGCNSSGTVDGTRFVLNANGGSYHVVTIAAAQKMYWWENIEVKNTAAGSYSGWVGVATGGEGHVWINCCSNTCGQDGWICSGNLDRGSFFRCVAYSNGRTGYSVSNGKYFFCVSRDNTTDGWNGSPIVMCGCVSHGNADDGIDGIDKYSTLLNCVSDGNTDNGIEVVGYTGLWSPVVIGCRVTNQSGSNDIGINAGARALITAYNYFEDNSDDNIQGGPLLTSGSLTSGVRYKIMTYVSDDDFTNVGAASNASGVVFVATGTTPTHWAHSSVLFIWLNEAVPLENSSTTSNIEDQADTNEGYLDKDNHDFSTNYTSATDPHLRRTAITLPWS